MTYNINMKFAYLFLILLLLAGPSFANSKYDVDLQYAAENFTAQELDEYFRYQKTHNPVYHRPDKQEINRQVKATIKSGNAPDNSNIMLIHRLPGGSFFVNY